MKKLFILLFAMLTVTMVNAQILIGDMNGDGKITMADANEVTNTYLGNKSMEYISTADNTMIQGTWYETKTKTVSFNADGTTDYISCFKYGYYPDLKAIIFFDKNGKLLSFRNILNLAKQSMSIDNQGVTINYTRTMPVYKVTSITLSKTDLTIAPDGYEVLTATVLPADADDKSYTWKSSDESVVMIVGDGRLVPLKLGTCTITCTANDGSGVKATCTVTVSSKRYENGYEYVDLGLSVKWATCNIGASKPENSGYYYAWGETKVKATYDWSTYTLCNGSSSTMTKYCTSWSYGKVDLETKTVLIKSDDAASVNWGGSWRMPTQAELDELRNIINCTWTWTTLNGVKGYTVTSKKNGNSIFLPAARNRPNSTFSNAGPYGYYWSSSLDVNYPNEAHDLIFGSNGIYSSHIDRFYGQTIRAVCP